MPSRTSERVIRDLDYSITLVIIKLKSKPEALRYPVFCYLYSAKNLDNMANIPQVTCIYKITSPSGKIYIGQTLNARRRFLDYKSKSARSQPGLNNSIKKYGWDKHTFDVIHYLPFDVTQDVLNVYECFYMDAYKSCGIKLLNVKEGGSNGRNSDESIKKANEKWKIWFKNNPDGIKKSVENSVLARKGKGLSAEHVEKIRRRMKGRLFTDSHRFNHAKSLKGKPKTITESFLAAQRAKGGSNKKAINQFNFKGELIKTWPSISHASNELGIERRGIAGCVNGYKGRKTFGDFIWRPESEGAIINIEGYIHNRSPKKKEVIQFTEKGEFVKEWASLTEAGNSLSIPVINISMCARGKSKSAGGFIWKYK